MVAVRDNERAAAARGINVSRTKLAAFAVSGAIAGVYSLSDKSTVAGTTISVAGQRVQFGGRYNDTKFIFVPPAAAVNP